MKITIFSKHSFIAYTEYDPEQEKLFVTMRGGKKYRIENFSDTDHQKLLAVENKGGYMAQHVLSGPNRKRAEYIALVPQEYMLRTIQANKPRLSHKFLAR